VSTTATAGPATCDSQLGVTATYETYASAAALLWGAAGEFAAAEFARLNRELFAGSIPPVPVIIGLTAYGKCIGATMPATWLGAPRITLAPLIFNRGGARSVSDALVHEMIHAALIFRGEDPAHNGAPWCKLITELSPDVAGRDIIARPVRTRRVPNPARETDPSAPKTIVKRMPGPGAMAQADLARWPHSLRPAGWNDGQRPIYVPTY
jgi:hypothetical protein